MIITTNPYTQKEIKQYSFLTNDELSLQLNAIHTGYQLWKNISLKEKERLGTKLNELILNQKYELANLISLEMGKPINESLGEIEKSASMVRYFCEKSTDFLKQDQLDDNTFISYHSTGAIFGIMPWNFPFWQVFRYAIPNILAGNVCVLKHAPNVFGCAKAIENLFIEAGFPKHVFTNLIIDIPQVETVIAHPVIQGVCVTGSEKAGSAVASLAGKYLKKSVLELGGSDAFAILNDADFNNALENAFISRIKNAGQVCIAAKRIFIPKERLTEAINFFTKKINQINLGDPLKTSTEMGPIAKKEFLPILQNQVESCIKHGAKLILGGKINSPFYEPTLLVANSKNPLLDEEIFGPVICIIPFENEIELISAINNSSYGLGAAIWSKDINKALDIAKRVETGHVSINTMVSSDPKIPFGGIKKSGYGKELGEQGFKTFLNAKTIFIEALEN